MFWFIVLSIIGYTFYKFFIDLNKDNHDLEHQSLNEKFEVIVYAINNHAYGGRGEIIPLDKRSFNLYETDQNQIINFMYSTGHLTITWKYKYFQKEVVHEKQFTNVRNLSIFQQQKIADAMISEMSLVIEHHKKNVIQGGMY